jgi:molybdopterin-guanine dinucleotide biosynthesis protein A
MDSENPVEICGLVLAGGKSRRMGVDKAGLRYGISNLPQWRVSAQLLAQFCAKVYLSVRKGQQLPDYEIPPQEASFPLLADQFEDAGPLAGLLTAMDCDPAKAWLVVACDLPRLDSQTVEYLIRNRTTSGWATAYRSSSDGLPEPLCALYEPGAQAILQSYWKENRCCPRKILITEAPSVQLLDLPNPEALDNANTPQDFARLS